MSETLEERKIRSRQVKDLPRISMAEPLAGFIDDFADLFDHFRETEF